MATDGVREIGSAPPRPLRQLYFELGVALAAELRHGEAVSAFTQALAESSERPGALDIRLELARAHAASNDAPRAFRTYLEAVLDAPDRASEILNEAHELLTREVAAPHADWLQREWTPMATRGAATTTGRVAILVFLGRVRLYLQDYGGARDLFEQARQLAADEPRVLEGLGESLWKIGDVVAARETLQRADAAARRGSSTRLPAITVKLSQVLAAAGDFEAALARLEQRSLEDDTYAYEMHLVHSRCALGLGRPDDARASAEAAARLRSGAVEPHVLRVRALIALGKYDEALAGANLAQQTDPSERQIGFYRAQALIEGQIDIDQGRRLLGRQVKRLGDRMPEIVRESLRSRDSDGNAHYFAAEVAFAERRMTDTIEEVDRALKLGLNALRPHPDAPAQQLKAEALVATGEPGEAARWFSDAGSSFLSRGEHRQAIDNLHQATRLHPTNENWWLLADALRMSSTATDSDTPDEKLLVDSVEAWNAGFALGAPTPDQSWAYLARAIIAVQLARVRPSSEQIELGWEAVVYLERAILLHGDEGYRWSLLCGYHRFLENEINALAASERAFTLDPDDVAVLEERIITTSNVGSYDIAQAVIATRLTLEPVAWAHAVHAYVLLHTGQYQEALAAIDAALERAPQDLWNLDMRAQCRRALGDLPHAMEDYAAIHRRSTLTDKNNLTLFGTAAYYLGRHTEAMTYFAARLEVASNERFAAHSGLGLACLVGGDLDQAEAHLHTAIETATLLSQLDDLIKFDFPDAERMLSGTLHAAEGREVLERTKQGLRARRAELASERSAEDELRAIAERLTRAQQTNGWAWIATQAGLARQLTERSAWMEAAAIYRALEAFGSRFAEAGVGVAVVVDACEASAQARMREGDVEGAVTLLREALDVESRLGHGTKLAELRRQIGQALLRAARPAEARDEFERGAAGADDLAQAAAFRARSAYAAFELGDRAAARSGFIHALRHYRDAAVDAADGSLGNVCVDLIDSVPKYWALDAEWRALAASDDVDAREREGLYAARRTLIRYLESAYQLSAPSDAPETFPVVTPIVLEIGERLIAEDTSTNVWPLFTQYIPGMRQRIRSATGVDVPGVRVRGSVEIEPGDYVILLDEVPRSRGTVQVGSRDEPQAHDPLESVIAQLETVLRQNLGCFVGLQEVDGLLATWRTSDSTSALLADLTTDDAARVRLARIIRSLIDAGIPVTNPDGILEAIREVGPASGPLDAVIVALRRQLKALLPGNAPSVRHVELPAECTAMLESWPRDDRDPPRLVPAPDQAQRFATALRALIDSLEPGSAVLVPDAGARSLVLDIAGAGATVPIVLTRDELAPRPRAAHARPAASAT